MGTRQKRRLCPPMKARLAKKRPPPPWSEAPKKGIQSASFGAVRRTCGRALNAFMAAASGDARPAFLLCMVSYGPRVSNGGGYGKAGLPRRHSGRSCPARSLSSGRAVSASRARRFFSRSARTAACCSASRRLMAFRRPLPT